MVAQIREVVGATLRAPTDGTGVARLEIDRPDDAVNALDPRLLDALLEAVRSARAQANLRGLVIVSAKPSQWVAGADLKLLAQAATARELEQASRRLQAICDELAWLPCTTVAAINGAALGGGLELALACDYRVAADDPAVVLGLPEVALGLVPAGGGTQRLPRLIGLAPALDLILSGRRLDARRARRVGLVDEVVHPRVLEAAAVERARGPKRSLGRPLRPSVSQTTLGEMAELTANGRRVIYARARGAVLRRTGGHYPAPLRALEAVHEGLEHGMARGLEAEARAFGALAMSTTARHLIWLFGATQRQRHPSVDSAGRVERVGVVGAGFMGAAIAEVAAGAGITVRIRDTSVERVARALTRIRIGLSRTARRRGQGALRARALGQHVSGTTGDAGFARADVVIEAVYEDLSVKRAVLADLERVLPAETVIASNTSALPLADLAAGAQHPERIVGMHFFSPAQRMPLVEVVRPAQASSRAVERVVQLAQQIGKTPIVVADGPGFYTTRVLGVMLNEAALLIEAGASVEAVDAAMTAFGFPVGPFVLYDEVGLEVALHAGQTIARAFGDRLPASTIVERLVARGATGRAAGAGFYLWPTRRPAPPLVGRLLPQPGRRPNPAVLDVASVAAGRPFTTEMIQERLVLAFVNEAARCLDAGVIASAADGDLGAVLGLGFPPFLGGPFHHVDHVGASALVSILRRLARDSGPRYDPATILVEQARADQTFF